MVHSASDIAKIILMMSNPEVGDIISNLKLQKLLYYAQGFHLAIHDAPLFEEDVEAWMYGPVVPGVYREYKSFGSGAIEKDENFEVPESVTEGELSLIQEVYEVYGQFSALKLMELTHEEDPWRNIPAKAGSVISKESMGKFFKTRI
ncbi:MAG: DUF4065 domain-containing protein [Prevotellaceae bacterium]|jgi:uncharacterized phage-associated protein|nr:DUF4065 domain-containing protein [Prevotellaceae bacterium]